MVINLLQKVWGKIYPELKLNVYLLYLKLISLKLKGAPLIVRTLKSIFICGADWSSSYHVSLFLVWGATTEDEIQVTKHWKEPNKTVVSAEATLEGAVIPQDPHLGLLEYRGS